MPLAGVLTAHSVVVVVALLVVLSASPTCRATHNITSILAARRDLAEFSRQLTATGLADDINGRNTITVLAVDDAHMAPLKARGLPRQALRHVLSLHVLVDYYDDAKLHGLPGGSAVVSTLFQASGDAPGSAGMVEIAERRGGRVAFVPQEQEADDARAAVFYVKSVHEAPYNISVLQVSAVISSPAAEAPSRPESRPNATDVMSRNGCGRFAALVAATGDAAAVYETSMSAGGLTLFCPADKAMRAFIPVYKNLTSDEQLALVLYHAVPRHYSMAALKANNGAGVNTLAMYGSKNTDFTVRNVGNTVTLLSAARNPATVTGTLMDADPLAVYIIDAVLLPREGSSAPWAHIGPEIEPGAPSQDGEGGDRDKKNGASGAAPCRLSFTLAFLLAIRMVLIV